jgi:ABC-type multidrug transport system fused ATPase/permease subunit
MMEASSGSVKFDGVDISTLGLYSVRNSISIIPQDPVLFSGTLRFNLDPFDQYLDADIWGALEKASLKNCILQKGDGLLTKVSYLFHFGN